MLSSTKIGECGWQLIHSTLGHNGLAVNFLMSHNRTLRNKHLTIEIQHCMFVPLLSWADGNGLTRVVGGYIMMRARCNDVNDRPRYSAVDNDDNILTPVPNGGGECMLH